MKAAEVGMKDIKDNKDNTGFIIWTENLNKEFQSGRNGMR